MHIKYLLLTVISVVSATSLNDNNTQSKGLKKQGFWGHCNCDEQLREVSCKSTSSARRNVINLCDIGVCRTCVEDDIDCSACKVYLNNIKFLGSTCNKYKFDIKSHNDREF